MTDCAILAVASTAQTVRALLERLVKDVVDEHASVVPWTIVNRYYTAEVRFLVHTLSSWVSIRDQPLAPAILFVWNRGEPYRDHVRKLSQDAPQHEFEVTLAVRLPSSSSQAVVEDDQDIDAYLSSNGFEFVDVPDSEPSAIDRSGIPRIVDALSTIMWPSMVRHTSKRVMETDSIGAVQPNSGFSSVDYHHLMRLVGERISGNDDDRMRRELEELERWLEEDTSASDADAQSAGGDDDSIPWSTAVTPGTLSPSSGFIETSRPTTPSAGFDDDFTSFVSAPSTFSAGIPQLPSENLSSPHRSPPLASTSFSSTLSFYAASSGRLTSTFDEYGPFDTTHLAPGDSYKSLGSVSDFGDSDKDPIVVEQLSDSSDKADGDMPSRVEIAETSLRIFGTPLLLSPTYQRRDENLTVLGGVPSQHFPGQENDVEMTDANLERFDLQSVLNALQGLKEEIAAMPDKERRKAAARVALGLACGLHGDPHSEAGEEPV